MAVIVPVGLVFLSHKGDKTTWLAFASLISLFHFCYKRREVGKRHFGLFLKPRGTQAAVTALDPPNHITPQEVKMAALIIAQSSLLFHIKQMNTRVVNKGSHLGVCLIWKSR